MSDQLELVTTVHALTSKTHDREALEQKADQLGYDSVEELLDDSKETVRAQLSTAFEEDALELLEITTEVNEVDDAT